MWEYIFELQASLKFTFYRVLLGHILYTRNCNVASLSQLRYTLAFKIDTDPGKDYLLLPFSKQFNRLIELK